MSGDTRLWMYRKGEARLFGRGVGVRGYQEATMVAVESDIREPGQERVAISHVSDENRFILLPAIQ